MTKRRVVAGVVVLALVGAGVGYWLAAPSGSGGSSSAAATITYRSVAASLGTVRQSVTATGTIAPAEQDSLNFAVAGTVTAVKVTEGDHVRKGQVLARVDSPSARASLASAQATLADAEARQDSDTSAGASSTQLAADSTAVSAAKAQVSSAKTALASAALTSPITGLVVSVDLTKGQQVAASGSSGTGSGDSGGSGGSGASGTGSTSSAQIVVISDSSWIVNTSVDDTEVGLLAKGDQAQIVPGSSSGTSTGTSGFGGFAALGGGAAARLAGGGTAGGGTGGAGGTGGTGGTSGSGNTGGTGTSGGTGTTGSTGSTVYGTISSIGMIASSSSGVASFPVVVAVTGSPSGLHSGASATVTLIYKQLTNVLTVPTTAVHRSGTGSYVLQSENGKQVQTAVGVGMASGGLTQITSGLSSGDEVLEPQVAVTRSGGNATSSTGNGTSNRGGGLGGAGFGGGGFGGGGFGGR